MYIIRAEIDYSSGINDFWQPVKGNTLLDMLLLRVFFFLRLMWNQIKKILIKINRKIVNNQYMKQLQCHLIGLFLIESNLFWLQFSIWFGITREFRFTIPNQTKSRTEIPTMIKGTSFEILASLGIMGDQLRAPQKHLINIWNIGTEEFKGGLQLSPERSH